MSAMARAIAVRLAHRNFMCFSFRWRVCFFLEPLSMIRLSGIPLWFIAQIPGRVPSDSARPHSVLRLARMHEGPVCVLRRSVLALPDPRLTIVSRRTTALVNPLASSSNTPRLTTPRPAARSTASTKATSAFCASSLQHAPSPSSNFSSTRLEGVGKLHALVAEHAEEPTSVVVGIETDRGLLVESLLAAGEVFAINPLAASRYGDRHATSGAKSDPGARRRYDLLRGRGQTHHQTLRALGNRLVGILHGCLTSQTTYREHIAWRRAIDVAA